MEFVDGSRRHCRQWLAALCCWQLVWVAASAQQPAPPAPPPRPNIVYILADDLGYGELGCYGQQKIETPQIDRLAAEGISFTAHYAGAPVCAPSRCVLMTGLHTGHAYVRDNRGKPVIGQLPIPDETVTVAELLKDAGYRTGVVGKWGLGGPDTTGLPNLQGFDFFYGYLDQWRAHDYYPEYLWRNQRQVPLEGNEDGGQENYSHDRMTEAALEFLADAPQEHPFFLYVAYTIPHVSLQVPDDSLEQYRGRFPETPYPGAHYAGHDQPRAAYAAMISRMDLDVGRIMAELKRRKLDQDTLVIFSSDNGPTYAGGADAGFFNSAGELRGLKGSLYEGGIRVPMIARWPEKIEPGSKSDHPSAFWDLLPTFTELAGAKTPDAIDGISMVATLLGKPERQAAHEYLYWEHRSRMQAVRMGDWTAVRKKVGGPVELYDLATDPGEERNVAGSHKEVVKQIERIFVEGRTPSEHFPLKQPESGE